MEDPLAYMGKLTAGEILAWMMAQGFDPGVIPEDGKVPSMPTPEQVERIVARRAEKVGE